MTTIQGGEFWVADIPFTSGEGSKKRPILVLWLDGNDVVAAVVTSAKPRTQTDVPLNDWAASGLRVPSTVRLSRLDCLVQSLLLAKIGQVSESDAKHLKELWDLYIAVPNQMRYKIISQGVGAIHELPLRVYLT